MKLTFKHIIINALATLFLFVGFAQDKVDIDFNFQVDQILKNQTKDYSELNTIFKNDLKDTLKMRFLAKKSNELNYLEGESFALCNLGIFFRDKSLYNQSIAFHQNAYNLAYSAENIELQIINLNMLGVVNRRIDNYTKAIDYHQEALILAESQPKITQSLKQNIAVSYNSIGNIYLAIKEPDIALDNFDKSLSLEKENDNSLGLAMNYHNIGYAFEEKGDLDLALENYNKSLQYNTEINSIKGILISNNSIAQINLKREKPEEAVKVLEKNLELSFKTGDLYYISSTYIGLGWAQYEINKLQESEFNLIQGLKIAEERNMPSNVSLANFHLSELYKKKGDFKNAFERYLIADKINHNITGQQNKNYISSLRIRYETEKLNNENKQYEQQLEIQELQIKENRRNSIVALLGILIVAGVFLIVGRQRRLKNEKKIVTLEQDMLRSQMNPHFIFNSLNSIKLYIINNEKENAVYYLNKFSKLIRKILMASKEKEITLAEELDTMKLYMNIENIRFSNEIDYKTSIDKDVDLEAIKVPSLILQPFLENALWHGLSSKKNDKKIRIDVTKENENIILISITDNGIGRKEAERIKRNKSLKRKSLGLAITNERLSNFYKEYNREYKVEILDLYDTNEMAKGTKVLIMIPIEKAVKLRTA